MYVAGELSVSGGTNSIIEYFGSGVESISCTGKATITNMGAELGATTSIFPYDDRMGAYLEATRRSDLATLAEDNKDLLVQDEGIEKDPETYFDRVVEIVKYKLKKGEVFKFCKVEYDSQLDKIFDSCDSDEKKLHISK